MNHWVLLALGLFRCLVPGENQQSQCDRVSPGGVRQLYTIQTGAVRAVSFSPDAKVLASTSLDGSVRLWSLTDSREVGHLKGPRFDGSVVAFSADGKYLAVTSSVGERGAVVWTTEADEPCYWLPVAALVEPSSVAFSPDHKHIAVGSRAYTGGFAIQNEPRQRLLGTIEVWNVDDFKSHAYGESKRPFALEQYFRSRGALSKHTDAVASVAFSPNGNVLAAGGWGRLIEQGSIAFWNIPDGNLIRKIDPLESPVGHIAFSPDGSLLSSVGSHIAHIRRYYGTLEDLDEEVLRRLDRYARSSDSMIFLWNQSDGMLSGRLVGHEAPVTSTAWSPDGRYLASSGMDATVRIWEVKSRSPVTKLSGHRGSVLCVAFSSDGKKIASGGTDMSVRIWDVEAAIEPK